ncbi:MAG: DUF3307 domain-containing protein [Verrucomicrobiales bacterium]
MPDTLTLSFQPVTGPASAAILLFALLIGHAFADFPLQGEFLSQGKNRNNQPPRLADGKKSPKDLWVYLMTAHCLIHAGFVWVVSGYVVLAFAEFVLHWVIDVVKCEGSTSFATDQWLHVATKVLYVVLIWLQVV